MNWAKFYSNLRVGVLDNFTEIVIILFLTFIALKIVNIFARKIVNLFLKTTRGLEAEKKIRTSCHIVKSILDVLILVVAFILILDNLGINIGPILAAAGVLGVAIGFGSQRLIEDFISGMLIISSDQIRVGDVVEIAGKSGFVEKVDLKMVVLRDLSGNVHFIRNGKIDIVTNMTKDFSFYVAEIGVAYKENVEYVIEVIKEVGDALMREDYFAENILEPLEVLGLDKFDDSAVVIKTRIKTRPIKQWEVGRAFNLRLKKKFDELGIEIPFPHRTLYFGENLGLKNE